jgi:hypothetical protein
MQPKQQFARVATGRLGCKTGHRTYGHDERGAIRLPSPAMAGLNPSSADGTRPHPALLVANENPASDQALCPVVNQDGLQRGADLDAAERAAADLLTALGIDLDREERRATPARTAPAYAELLAARQFRLTTFPDDVRSGSGSCACRRNQQ